MTSYDSVLPGFQLLPLGASGSCWAISYSYVGNRLRRVRPDTLACSQRFFPMLRLLDVLSSPFVTAASLTNISHLVHALEAAASGEHLDW